MGLDDNLLHRRLKEWTAAATKFDNLNRDVQIVRGTSREAEEGWEAKVGDLVMLVPDTTQNRSLEKYNRIGGKCGEVTKIIRASCI